MSVKFPQSAAGRMTELVSKAGRKEKESDVLMWVSTAKDKPSGEMKAQLRGVGTTSFFQKARNAFLARQAASAANIRNLFMQRGMTSKQADAALVNVAKIGKHYSAKSVNVELQKFDDAQRAEKQRAGNFSASDGKFLAQEFFYGKREFELKESMQNLTEDYNPKGN